MAEARALQPYARWHADDSMEAVDLAERRIPELLQTLRKKLDDGRRSSREDAPPQKVISSLESMEAELRAAVALLDAKEETQEAAGSTAHKRPVLRKMDATMKMGDYKHHREHLQSQQWRDADYVGPGNYDFFKDICIARDGGFSEVDQLWYWTRWISALSAILIVVSNLATICVNDVGHIFEAYDVWWQDRDTPGEFVQDLWNGLRGQLGFGRPADGKPNKLSGASVMSLIELALLAIIVLRAVRAVCISMATEGKERRRWTHVTSFYWRLLPELCSFSGMRLLHFVSPVIVADFTKFVSYSQTRWAHSPFLIFRKWLQFVLTRLFCLFVGMGSFIVKLEQSRSYLPQNDAALGLWNLINLLMFIKQILGIVQLQQFVRARIYLFIFGGEDSIMEPHERACQMVWEGMLARAIYSLYSWPQAVAIMLTFSDEDFQKLVLNARGKDGTPGAGGKVPRAAFAEAGLGSKSSESSGSESSSMEDDESGDDDPLGFCGASAL